MIRASQAANIKDILSKYESENVVSVENKAKEVHKDESDKSSKVKLELGLEIIQKVEPIIRNCKADATVI